MDKTPSPESKDQSSGAPAAEVLKPRTDDGAMPSGSTPSTTLSASSEAGKKLRRRTYRPSHKATFIALGVVVAILAINAVVLGFVLKNKSKSNDPAAGQVTISESVLNKVGVNKTAIGNSGVLLTIDPDTQFNGKLKAAGDVTIGGQLKLNSKFSADSASLAQLEAGKTSLSELNVSGATTLSALNLRTNLAVAGTTTLQGAVTISQLLTVSGNLNLVGNLAVGGTISTAGFVARNLASTGTLTIGGHVITSGLIPAIGAGNALGSNGTVAINGNDSAGTINIATGVGANAGTIASIAFRTQYNTIPRIVLTGVNTAATFYVISPSIGGFTIGVGSGLPPGGYAVNYIVEE